MSEAIVVFDEDSVYDVAARVDDETYTELVNYISHKNYPVGYSKKQKRRLREKAQSFYVSNQSLFHKSVKGNVTVTVVGEVFVDILRRTCFLYLSYIKGNGRCGHFATSFVLLNW